MKNAILAMVFGFLGAGLFQFVQFHWGSEALAGNEKVISASGFDLVDKNGKLRAQLGFSKEGPPGFWIMDEKGIARVAMGLYPDGTSHFGLQDKKGLMIQLMRSLGNSEAPLLIFKNKGMDKMILGLNSTSLEPSLISYDQAQKKKVHSGFSDGP